MPEHVVGADVETTFAEQETSPSTRPINNNQWAIFSQRRDWSNISAATTSLGRWNEANVR